MEKLVIISASKSPRIYSSWSNYGKRVIKQKTLYAQWWSHAIRPEHDNELQSNLPIKLYVYVGGKVRHLITVKEFVSEPGNHRIPCPWSEYVSLDGEQNPNPPARSRYVKTWFLITKFKPLEKLLDLTDFTLFKRRDDIEDKDLPSSLISSFGYGYIS
jgi:hypothetical protein